MTDRLAGKVAIVTGAGSGIGRAVAELFHRQGAKVVAADVSGDEKATCEALGVGALPVSADMSRRSDVDGLVAQAIDEFGAVDVLCNCAAVEGVPAPLVEYPDDQLDRILNVNLKGVLYAMRAAHPALARSGRGSIVNFASTQALFAVPAASGYAASKGGVISMSRVAALEFASSGVRVNIVCPGLVDTPMMKRFRDAAPPGALDQVVAATPLARLARPEEMAQCALFLASDESSYVTGSILTADGGYTSV
jgi:NAD(P)-dependent dehydrogenase (short-subunit alcohol dehydrogenase family)